LKISPNDRKQYHHQTLENGLKVLFISDPDGQKSAASLAVNVGHFHDPRSRQGLAHFLEHMLFLGTQKYPNAGEYQGFINRHGGTHNAWTGTEYTNYFFDINTDRFIQALDRFSQFFIAPSFDAELVDKERQSVHSEYQLKIRDDVRRIYQVHKETINPAHPFCQFSVGSLETLADNQEGLVRDALIDFYQKNYSADRMTLAVYTPLPIDQMLALVAPFKLIPRVQWQQPDWPPMLREQDNRCYIYAKPNKDMRKLTLSFQFDSVNALYREKPLTFLAHQLGYEGSGSLIAYLRKQGLINTMTAGGGVSGSNFREFTLSYNLTPAGLDAVEYIIEASFYYLRLVERQGLQAWRYQEKQHVLERAFLYQERSRPLDMVSHLALNLHHYPAEDVIFGDYAMDEFNQESILKLIGQMVPDNLRVTLIAKEVKTTRNACWYDTPFHQEAIDENLLSKWRDPAAIDSLTLPSTNPFIPKSKADIHIDEGSTHPRIITEDPGFRLWFKQDPEFPLPKGHIYVSVDSEYAVKSARHIALCRLTMELLLDHLSEITYQAEIAGMHYQLYAHQGGYTIHTSGFSDKQLLLLKMILGNRLFGHFEPSRFDIIKKQLVRHWNNQAQSKPISQLFNQLSALLQPNNPPPQVLASAIEDVTLEEMPTFIEKLYEHVHLEILAYGNWREKHVLALGEYVRSELAPDAKPAKETPRQLIDISQQGTQVFPFQCDHNDSAILMYFQSKETTAEQIALFTLSNHLMSSTFFHELRTKQQLGYVVGSSNLPLNRHAGLIFYIQSPHADPMQLLDAIDDFLDEFPILTFELSHKQWQASKDGLAAQILERETNMRTRAKHYWTSIGIKDYTFDQRQRIVDALERLNRADVVRFMMTLKSKHRDRLLVFSTGQSNTGSASFDLGQAIPSIAAFHHRSRRYRYN
jgi:secreted Zn-dependent insulinase-like peptidase